MGAADKAAAAPSTVALATVAEVDAIDAVVLAAGLLLLVRPRVEVKTCTVTNRVAVAA